MIYFRLLYPTGIIPYGYFTLRILYPTGIIPYGHYTLQALYPTGTLPEGNCAAKVHTEAPSPLPHTGATINRIYKYYYHNYIK